MGNKLCQENNVSCMPQPDCGQPLYDCCESTQNHKQLHGSDAAGSPEAPETSIFIQLKLIEVQKALR